MFLSFFLWIRGIKPIILGSIVRFLLSGNKLIVGNNFKCDSIPDFNITERGKVIIGNNVVFRRNVEIRTHKDSVIVIGSNTRLDRGVRILATNEAKVTISDGARIGLYSVLNGGDSILVGKNTLISGFVYLQTSMHRYDNKEYIKLQGFCHLPVKLDKDVWVGTHAVIMPGVSIGKGSIVGSNAVVTNNIGSNEVVVGIPAKKIKNR